MNCIYVFDLDGTLIDTQKAVREAYRIIGVEMPADAWGRPWKEWLNDPFAHQCKNDVYPKMVAMHARALPLFDHATRLNAPILTGASPGAVHTIKSWFWGLNIALVGASLEDKARWLNAHERRPLCYYVDDLESARRYVKTHTRWIVLAPDEALEQLERSLTLL